MNTESNPPFPWTQLGIAPTRDIAEIKRAYAQHLKTIDVAADPMAFQTLRQAYEVALAMVTDGSWVPS